MKKTKAKKLSFVAWGVKQTPKDNAEYLATIVLSDESSAYDFVSQMRRFKGVKMQVVRIRVEEI